MEGYLSHRLSKRAAKDRLQIGTHTRRYHNHQNKAKQPTRSSRINNAPRHSLRCIGSLFAHMNTRVETSDRPNRRKPSQKEGPARRPGRKIGRCSENIGAVISTRRFSDWERDDGGEDEDQIHDHEDGLQFTHDLGHG